MKEHKDEWEEIERDYYRGELTVQGYKKHRNKLFIKAKFIPQPRDPKEQHEVGSHVESLVNGATGTEKSLQNKQFQSTYQCTEVRIYLQNLFSFLKFLHTINKRELRLVGLCFLRFQSF